MSHALLSASASSRWIACTPSARICAGIEDRASPYAAQGTDAHTLGEYKILKALGKRVRDPTEDLEYFDAEMDDATDEYAGYVMERYCSAKHPLIRLEERVDYSRWVPEGFGTADCLIVSDGKLEVIDLKYGLGILVSAERNPQLMCYALGALEGFGFLTEVSTVRMTIFQPRRGNVSSYEMEVGELISWAEGTLKPAAQMAYSGEGEFVPGDHCLFCKVKATCKARADHNLAMARYDFEVELSDEDIAKILPQLDQLVSWANDLKEHALNKAIGGTHFPGYKLVEGRSTRRFSDDESVAKVLSDAGYDPYEKKLMGITALTSMLGKKRFEELLNDYVVKPQGKPTLVPESDKRKAISAADDFRGGNDL